MELGGNFSEQGRRNQPNMGRTENQHEACFRPSRHRGNSIREIPENPAGKPNCSNLLGGIPANQSRSPIRGQHMHRSISRWITPRSKKALGHERNTGHRSHQEKKSVSGRTGCVRMHQALGTLRTHPVRAHTTPNVKRTGNVNSDAARHGTVHSYAVTYCRGYPATTH